VIAGVDSTWNAWIPRPRRDLRTVHQLLTEAYGSYEIHPVPARPWRFRPKASAAEGR
jgi:hypothetical protein